MLPLVIQTHNEFQQNTEESKNLNHPESALEMKPSLLLEWKVIHIKRQAEHAYIAIETLIDLFSFSCVYEM